MRTAAAWSSLQPGGRRSPQKVLGRPWYAGVGFLGRPAVGDPCAEDGLAGQDTRCVAPPALSHVAHH